MARRGNIWEQIWESTEGPTVTLNLPREQAEMLLGMIASALDMEGGGDDLGGDMMDDPDADMDFGADPGGSVDGGELDFGDDSGGDDALDAAGEMDDEPTPPKKGRGRPPGSKNKPKDDTEPKKKDSGDGRPKAKPPEDDGDDDSDDKKDESAIQGESRVRSGARLAAYVPRRARR